MKTILNIGLLFLTALVGGCAPKITNSEGDLHKNVVLDPKTGLMDTRVRFVNPQPIEYEKSASWRYRDPSSAH